MEYRRIRNLAQHAFTTIFKRRMTIAGYYNPQRDTDELFLKILIWYYSKFRKKLWHL